jgi:2-polyprenyl-3-methyl-5-hydroxy-6-metoxy-1,4-benzoquinol methylase
MLRRVEPEWLDELPSADPRAVRSRGDLRRINALMGNARIVAGELRRASSTGLRTIAEIGAGDGAFAARLAPALGKHVHMTLVDQQDIVTPATIGAMGANGVDARVVRADVFDWLVQDKGPFDAIVANLFLHHFEGERLAELLRLVARRTRLFVACEPRRSAAALAGSRLLGLIGCNDVTRHDAVASVRAGFDDGELTGTWPDEPGWALAEHARAPFSHCFVARRTR